MARPRDPDEVVIALAGQPNCGKSTLFNAAAGFRVLTGNFAGTSVTCAETSMRLRGRPIRLVDLPGTYSISSADPAEQVARDFLLSGDVDAIINVVDAALLPRSLELTLQLIEMRVPLVLCLNMMDEARRKGIAIDERRLAELTGVPAQPAVAALGTGLEEVFREALRAADGEVRPILPVYDRDVEGCLARMSRGYPLAVREGFRLPERFVLLRLLEMDAEFEHRVAAIDPGFLECVRGERRRLAEQHGWPEAGVLASHRHALVLDLYEKVATHRRGAPQALRERIDRFLINPLGGFVVVLVSLLFALGFAFYLGERKNHA